MSRTSNIHPLSCYLIGSESILIQCAGVLVERGHVIRGIVSDVPAIAAWARANGVPTLDAQGDLAAKLTGEFDFLFSIANLKVLPPNVLARPNRGAINFHDGPLPAYAGLNAPLWALLNGERQHEITWHAMHAEVDDGDVLIEQRFEIAPDETALTLNAKCFAAGIDGFRLLLDGIEAHTLKPVPQVPAGKAYFGKWARPPAAFVLDFSRRAEEIGALVRATDFGRYDNPFGSAKVLNGGRCVRVGKASVRQLPEPAAAGTVLEIGSGEIVIAADGGAVALSEFSTLRGRGLAATAAADFLRLHPRGRVDLLDTQLAARLTDLNSELARHEPFWIKRLADLDPIQVPYARGVPSIRTEQSSGAMTFATPEAFCARFAGSAPARDALMAGIATYLARLADRTDFDLAIRDVDAGLSEILDAVASDWIPLRVAFDANAPTEEAFGAVVAAIHEARRRRTFLHDIVPRSSSLRAKPELTAGDCLPVMIEVAAPEVQGPLPNGVVVRFTVSLDGGSGCIDWDPRSIDRQAGEAMALQLVTFLEGMARAGGPALATPLTSAVEEARIRSDWNATQATYPAACVHALIDSQSRASPGKIAAIAGETEITYAELGKRANRIAYALRAMGAGRGQRVGVSVERGVEMLAAVLGVLKTGAAYVPLDPGFPDERLRFMAEDANLAAVILTSDMATTFPHSRDKLLLLDTDAAIIAAQPDGDLPVDDDAAARPEDPAYVIYTSGSTGRPKGVVVPHRAVSNFLWSMRREPGLTPDDVLLAVTTLSFDIAVLELFLPLVVGGTVVIAGREDASDGERLVALILGHEVTVMQATPVTWRLLLAADWQGGSGFKALVGGEALPRDLAESLIAMGVELWNMYGPTETTVWSTCGRVTGTGDGITIGNPIANTTIWILDSRGQLRPAGVPGEIYIGGAGVTLGYWNRLDLTSDRFTASPFDGPGVTMYRTGDQGLWRQDGTIEHLGRLDDQVKLRGFRIELGEIEAGIQRHSAVHQACVMVREDVPGDKRLVAYVVAERAPASLFDELRALVRETMPEYMVPAQFVRIDAMPRTPNGKRDRKALPVPIPEPRRSDVGFVAPRNAIEKKIGEIWASVLLRDEIGADDNFFDIGGNSILLMEIVSRVRQLGFEIKPLTMFRYPTVASLVQHLKGADAVSATGGAIARAEKQRAALARQRSVARRA